MRCLLGHFLFGTVLLGLLEGFLFGFLPVPGHVAELITAEVQVAQVDEVEVASGRFIGLVVLVLVGKFD